MVFAILATFSFYFLFKIAGKTHGHFGESPLENGWHNHPVIYHQQQTKQKNYIPGLINKTPASNEDFGFWIVTKIPTNIPSQIKVCL